MNPSGIKPLDVKLLVRPDPVEEKTKGGILLPEQHKEREKFAAVKATVVAVGDNAFADWGEAAKPEPGARVMMAQYAGANVKGVDGGDYRLCNDEDIIAVLEEA